MRRYLVRCSVTLLYLFVIISCSKSNNGPPDWRMPTANELSSSWRSINPDKFSIVRGDFNGDGVIDEAKLLVRKDGTGIGLFAFVSENGKYKTFLLEEIKNKLQIDHARICISVCEQARPGLRTIAVQACIHAYVALLCSS